MTSLRGMGYLAFGTLGVTIQDPGYLISSRFVAGVPLLVIALVILYLFVYIVLTHTTFGRNIYAVGGNPAATRAAAVERSGHLHRRADYRCADERHERGWHPSLLPADPAKCFLLLAVFVDVRRTGGCR